MQAIACNNNVIPKDFFDMILPSTIKLLTDHYILGDSYRIAWAVREYPPSTEEQAILAQLADRNGVADDKGIYYFVPKMIKYYLGEEALLSNAPTYLPFYEDDMKYVLDNFDNLVIKDVAEAGGYGVVFGNSLTKEKRRILSICLKMSRADLLRRRLLIFTIWTFLMKTAAEYPEKLT